MLNLCVLLGVVCYGFVMVSCDNNAGPGLWSVQYLELCQEDRNKLKINMVQEKINRTHDAWNGHFNFEETFNFGFAVRVEICQLVDGGYRLLNEISEPELIDYLMRCAEKNVQLALTAAKVDPPEFPIQAGEYDLENFIFDYSELDRTGFYGEYSGKVVVMSGIEEVFCIRAFVKFSEEDD